MERHLNGWTDSLKGRKTDCHNEPRKMVQNPCTISTVVAMMWDLCVYEPVGMGVSENKAQEGYHI